MALSWHGCVPQGYGSICDFLSAAYHGRSALVYRCICWLCFLRAARTELDFADAVGGYVYQLAGAEGAAKIFCEEEKMIFKAAACYSLLYVEVLVAAYLADEEG